MPRAFIKPINGNMRMRFVKAGFDADDLDLHPNNVIFDSTSIAVGSVLKSGIASFTTVRDDVYAWRTLTTWTSLGYIPHAIVTHDDNRSNQTFGGRRGFSYPDGSMPDFCIDISTTTLRARFRNPYAYQWNVSWNFNFIILRDRLNG